MLKRVLNDPPERTAGTGCVLCEVNALLGAAFQVMPMIRTSSNSAILPTRATIPGKGLGRLCLFWLSTLWQISSIGSNVGDTAGSGNESLGELPVAVSCDSTQVNETWIRKSVAATVTADHGRRDSKNCSRLVHLCVPNAN